MARTTATELASQVMTSCVRDGHLGNGGGVQPNRKDADRSRNVLDLPLADIDKGYVQVSVHLIAHGTGDAYSAWFSNGLQPRGDVDTVACDVVAVDDDIAEVDADPELNPFAVDSSRLRSAIARCTSIAQRKAESALPNSTSIPSPDVLTICPPLSLIVRSIRLSRISRRRATVPASSRSMSRL